MSPLTHSLSQPRTYAAAIAKNPTVTKMKIRSAIRHLLRISVQQGEGQRGKAIRGSIAVPPHPALCTSHAVGIGVTRCANENPRSSAHLPSCALHAGGAVGEPRVVHVEELSLLRSESKAAS